MTDEARRDHSHGPAPSMQGPSDALEPQIQRVGDRALARLAEELRAASDGTCDGSEGEVRTPSERAPIESSEEASGVIRLTADDVARMRASIQPSAREAPRSGSADQEMLDGLGY